MNIPHDAILRLWREHAKANGYDYNTHIEIGKELEKRGHRFVRYADDFLVMVRSAKAAEFLA